MDKTKYAVLATYDDYGATRLYVNGVYDNRKAADERVNEMDKLLFTYSFPIRFFVTEFETF